jgi:hypothetical protein
MRGRGGAGRSGTISRSRSEDIEGPGTKPFRHDQSINWKSHPTWILLLQDQLVGSVPPTFRGTQNIKEDRKRRLRYRLANAPETEGMSQSEKGKPRKEPDLIQGTIHVV